MLYRSSLNRDTLGVVQSHAGRNASNVSVVWNMSDYLPPANTPAGKRDRYTFGGESAKVKLMTKTYRSSKLSQRQRAELPIFQSYYEYIYFLQDWERQSDELDGIADYTVRFPELPTLVNSYFPNKFLPGFFKVEVIDYWTYGYAATLLDYVCADIKDGLSTVLTETTVQTTLSREPVLQRSSCARVRPPPIVDKTEIRLFSNPTVETCEHREACPNEVLTTPDEGIWCHSCPFWFFIGPGTSPLCRLDIKTTADAIFVVYDNFSQELVTHHGKQKYYTVRLKKDVALFVVDRKFLRTCLLSDKYDFANDTIMILECHGVVTPPPGKKRRFDEVSPNEDEPSIRD